MLSIGGDGTATAQKTTGMTFGKVLLIVLIIIVIVILLAVFAGSGEKKAALRTGKETGLTGHDRSWTCDKIFWQDMRAERCEFSGSGGEDLRTDRL